ncbi:MAG: hypothetical protein M3R06_11135, partial [Chloroflexota bacterium]|nr:hypothetical protein [Chloroflexota bacterium]
IVRRGGDIDGVHQSIGDLNQLDGWIPWQIPTRLGRRSGLLRNRRALDRSKASKLHERDQDSGQKGPGRFHHDSPFRTRIFHRRAARRDAQEPAL